jgi:hypothetical protein
MIVECKSCEALVDGQIVSRYHVPESPEYGGERITLLKCPKCLGPLLMGELDLGGAGCDSSDFDEPYRLYPAQDTRVNPALPQPIQVSFGEALACLKARAYTAAAIMCRKTLEGICSEHGVVTRNLGSGLKELRDKGLIENRLYDWADALRISGNEAAHDVKVTISADDARDIVEFTNALLEYVFTFRDKFEKFRTRRSGKARA